MGSKLVVEDRGKAKSLNWRHDCGEARPANKPCSCSRSSMLSKQEQGPNCKGKMIEFLCSCCFLCVCCPLAAVCCCIKLSCRICQQALRSTWQWACYGSRNRILATYSSFSDIDSDVTSGKVKPCISKGRTDSVHHLLRK